MGLQQNAELLFLNIATGMEPNQMFDFQQEKK